MLDINDWGASTDLLKGNKLVNLRHFIAMEALHAKLASIEKMVGHILFSFLPLHTLCGRDTRVAPTRGGSGGS